ncbi:unnamed protein product [Mycena citricolor]|uniref:CCHC-type domain-containing protein n=1 Tax=Mycena citricolor TaxID=2018698 RepID=A0AAD2HAU0_9AGAR|nr:unnamed protein product [Mycena citricolor]
MAPTITSALTIVLTTVPMLGKDNWAKFGKGFKVFLLGVDALWVMGKGPKADESDQVALDRMLLPYLYTKIEEQYQPLLDDFESATAAWAALKAHFEKSSMSTRMAARAELHSISHDPTKDIDVYIRAVGDAVKKLAAMGVSIDSTIHKDVLLMNLHPAFHTVRTILLARSPEPKLEDCITQLASSSSDPGVVLKIEDGDISSLALAASAPRRGTASATSSYTSPITGSIAQDGFPLDSQGFRWCDPTTRGCHRCGRTGHIAHKCMHTMPTFVKDWILANGKSSSASAAFSAALEAGLTRESFFEMWDEFQMSNEAEIGGGPSGPFLSPRRT